MDAAITKNKRMVIRSRRSSLRFLETPNFAGIWDAERRLQIQRRQSSSVRDVSILYASRVEMRRPCYSLSVGMSNCAADLSVTTIRFLIECPGPVNSVITPRPAPSVGS